METLARIVIPSEILDYFEIVNAEQTSSDIHIHLNELMNSRRIFSKNTVKEAARLSMSR